MLVLLINNSRQIFLLCLALFAVPTYRGSLNLKSNSPTRAVFLWPRYKFFTISSPRQIILGDRVVPVLQTRDDGQGNHAYLLQTSLPNIFDGLNDNLSRSLALQPGNDVWFHCIDFEGASEPMPIRWTQAQARALLLQSRASYRRVAPDIRLRDEPRNYDQCASIQCAVLGCSGTPFQLCASLRGFYNNSCANCLFHRTHSLPYSYNYNLSSAGTGGSNNSGSARSGSARGGSVRDGGR